MTSVAVVLVTHNSARWLPLTAASILEQTRQPDRIVIVDDSSTDDTLASIRSAFGERADVLTSESASTNRITRIAANFQQGIRGCGDADVAVLGDHDDIWLAGRIAHQVELLDVRPDVAMVASDGRLVDESGEPIGGTLRSIFPVPKEFNETDAATRMSTTLRHSIATGGASALRPAAFADLEIPPGWLHDRWWSLVATAKESMLVDETVVIDYRVTDDQEVGLDRGTQDVGGIARLSRSATSNGAGALRKLRDVQARLLPLSTDATRPELRTSRLVRNLLQRG